MTLTEQGGIEVSSMSVRGGDHIPGETDSIITHSMIGYCVPGNPIGHPVGHPNCALTNICLELCIYTVS